MQRNAVQELLRIKKIDICAAPSSPVFAGFLFLAGSLSTGGGRQRTGVRLLEVLFIQESIRVHQILQRGTGNEEPRVLQFHQHPEKPPNSPNRRHSCHWPTASTSSPCWGPEQVSLLTGRIKGVNFKSKQPPYMTLPTEALRVMRLSWVPSPLTTIIYVYNNTGVAGHLL